MVFVDPPYFLQLDDKKKLKRWKANTQVEPVYDTWDKFESFSTYDKFIKDVISKIKKVMKQNATLWVISTYHSIFRIGRIMQDLGFWILNDVIWVKTNPMPNWLGVRFTNAKETLFWAVMDISVKNYIFDRDYAKQIGIGKVGANVWVLPICAGRERLKNENGTKLHSTQKPLELLNRVIRVSTRENDMVLDPMAGTGTTGYAAKLLNRRYTMIENNALYIDGIRKRFEQFEVSEVERTSFSDNYTENLKPVE